MCVWIEEIAEGPEGQYVGGEGGREEGDLEGCYGFGGAGGGREGEGGVGEEG